MMVHEGRMPTDEDTRELYPKEVWEQVKLREAVHLAALEEGVKLLDKQGFGAWPMRSKRKNKV
jgi:hypothetical protein